MAVAIGITHAVGFNLLSNNRQQCYSEGRCYKPYCFALTGQIPTLSQQHHDGVASSTPAETAFRQLQFYRQTFPDAGCCDKSADVNGEIVGGSISMGTR